MRLTMIPRAALALAMIATIGASVGPARPALADEFKVTRTDDPNPTTTPCKPGDCSLRGAIIEANKTTGPDVILLPAGTYILTIPGADGGTPADNNALKGDLDIVNGSGVTIVGDGPDKTIIDGNGAVTKDRVFDIGPGGTLQIGGATVKGGLAGFGFQGHAHGGGIHNHGSLILQNVVISDNRVDVVDAANWGGGGITNADAPQKASASLTNVTIKDNQVVNTAGAGGGIENKAFLMLENSTLANNQARNGGGIDNRGTLALAGLINVTLADNRAVSNGVATNGFGGGIDNAGGATLTMIHATLSNNIGDSKGGNLAARAGGKSVTPRNTIFAGGSGGNCFIEATAGYSSGGHNLADDGNCNLGGGGDRPSAAIVLGPLQDNGGKTHTVALLPPLSDQPNDAIDACDLTDPIATDQRGLPRPRDGNGDGVPFCDMGAFEAQQRLSGDNNNNNHNDNDDNDNYDDNDNHDDDNDNHD